MISVSLLVQATGRPAPHAASRIAYSAVPASGGMPRGSAAGTSASRGKGEVMAHVDYFLKIEGIPGESKDGKHKGEIDVLSYSLGATQSGSMAYGTGGGAGKSQFQDFYFTMKTNVASPKLMDACTSGEHVSKAVLTVRKAGKDQQEFFKITMTDFIVSSYHSSDSVGGDSLPTDSISLNFAKIEFQYKEQKADGTLGGAIKGGWSLKENKAF